MASSKVVSSNPDLPRDSSSSSITTSSSSLSSLLSDLHHHSMDDLLKSIYTPNPNPKLSPSSASANNNNKSVDDVWKDIVAGGHSLSHRPSDDHPDAQMTLEDFLTKTGVVDDDDVTGGVLPPPSSVTVTVTPPPPPPPFSLPLPDGSSSVVEPFSANANNNNGIGAAAPSSSAASPSVSKGKRRAVEEPVDKATLQKQRRMIKNRESAARSRERKQAYTSELESLVLQLEQENAKLLSEEAEKNRRRYKELMEFLIPITEQPRPKRLTRTNSSQSW